MHRFYRISLMWGLALLCFQTHATEQKMENMYGSFCLAKNGLRDTIKI